MTLIVEDGTGKADAEAYISVADADTYHSNRGNTTWATITTAEKEQALRRATDYMGQVFRTRWQGFRVDQVQRLDWPRSWVVVDGYAVGYDSVPEDVQNACAEYAFLAAAGELLAAQGQQVIERTIGPMTTIFAPGSTATKRYPALEALLSPYCKIPAGMVQVVRR